MNNVETVASENCKKDDDCIVNRAWVVGYLGCSSSSIDRWEKSGDFPQRYQLAANRVGWSKRAVMEWTSKRPRGIKPDGASL